MAMTDLTMIAATLLSGLFASRTTSDDSTDWKHLRAIAIREAGLVIKETSNGPQEKGN